jgi:hypothetical protein
MRNPGWFGLPTDYEELACGNAGVKEPRSGRRFEFRGIHHRQHQRVTGMSFAKTRLPTIGTVEPDALNGRPTECEGRSAISGGVPCRMSFAAWMRERAALEAALKRCRVLADQIESILRNESPHFVDRVSLADFYTSIQRAADVLGQESRKSVENTPAPAVDSRARGRQRHR